MDEAPGMTPGVAADVLVLFGITGDLARKMLLPALYRLFERELLEVPVVGVTTRDLDLGALRAHVREAVSAAVADFDEKTFARFAERLRLVSGVDAHAGAYAHLEDAVHGYAAYYLAVPPSLFLPMAKALAGAGLNQHALLVVEKPFGHDLASARELESGLAQCFDDEHLLRVDHFLGDEAVRGLATLRESNALVRAVWSREWIESVQITLAEDFGVADRGSFYDPVGCVRDVIQNHLLQVLTFAAMEPATVGGDSQAQRMLRLLRAVRAVDPSDVVLGQYDGYREVEGVHPDSRTETFAALKVLIDDDRWDGVPFLLRSGKCLAATRTEVVIRLRSDGTKRPDLIRFGIRPRPGLTFDLSVQDPDPPHHRFAAPAAFDAGTVFGRRQRLPYETILHAVVDGDRTPFVPFPCIEESWRIVGKVIDTGRTPIRYAPGSWGPQEAQRLVGGDGWCAL